jgi:hypothetical protein
MVVNLVALSSEQKGKYKCGFAPVQLQKTCPIAADHAARRALSDQCMAVHCAWHARCDCISDSCTAGVARSTRSVCKARHLTIVDIEQLHGNASTRSIRPKVAVAIAPVLCAWLTQRSAICVNMALLIRQNHIAIDKYKSARRFVRRTARNDVSKLKPIQRNLRATNILDFDELIKLTGRSAHIHHARNAQRPKEDGAARHECR